MAEVAPTDNRLHIVDSMPVPVCRFRLRTRVPWPDFARASFCGRFRGDARYGKDDNRKDHADRQTFLYSFYGFRLHARLVWPGLIGDLVLAPANQSEQSILAPLVASAPQGCVVLGDRNYCVPRLQERLATDGQRLLTPSAR